MTAWPPGFPYGMGPEDGNRPSSTMEREAAAMPSMAGREAEEGKLDGLAEFPGDDALLESEAVGQNYFGFSQRPAAAK
jgi:hypothetical protein